ncbi:MAG TPA: GTP-dependent dephospho-CoA kinase family protein [Nitrosopumilaceae archaeon]|nr:GTP-dependent dephospho-CoA kinase family protein [Nitrosopumilaceae archaeon]
MRLPENLREQLKIPLGILMPNNQASKENILKQISENSFLVTIGDATTEKILSYGIMPSLQIIDAQEKRVKREPPKTNELLTNLSCKNPAGEITGQSIETIKQAIASKPPVRITVDGEEDLLVIPVCIFAPENTIIMYGQPNEGLVIVSVNDEIKKKTKSILDAMN